MGNGNIGVGNKTAIRKSSQQMAGAMSQQGAPTMGDNQCSPQEFVQLVGCSEPKAKLGPKVGPQPDLTKR